MTGEAAVCCNVGLGRTSPTQPLDDPAHLFAELLPARDHSAEPLQQLVELVVLAVPSVQAALHLRELPVSDLLMAGGHGELPCVFP